MEYFLDFYFLGGLGVGIDLFILFLRWYCVNNKFKVKIDLEILLGRVFICVVGKLLINKLIKFLINS